MNEIDKVEPQSVETTALITIKPEKYVTEVFAGYKKQLTKAKRDAKDVTYDITTTVGMELAKKLRASFREIRTSAESTRKERKAPIIQIGKLLDEKYKELEADIRPFEDKYDADIKAEEKRKEEEKQRKIAEERARVEAIENRIANIRTLPNRHIQSDSATIAKVIDGQSMLVLDPADFEEHLEDAINAVNASLVELENLRKIAVAREEEAKRIEAERAELTRLRAEREAEEKRRADEEARRAAEEAKRQAEITAAAEAQAKRIAELEAMLAASKAPVVEVTPEVAPIVVPVMEPVKPTRPSDEQIIEVLSLHFRVHESKVIEWLLDMDLQAASENLLEMV